MVMNYGVKTALGTLEGLRNMYERNGKAVDAELEGVFLSPPPLDRLNEEQRLVAQTCKGLETGTTADVVAWTKLKSKSPFVEISMRYTKPVGSEPT
jgi:hypothetical protein